MTRMKKLRKPARELPPGNPRLGREPTRPPLIRAIRVIRGFSAKRLPVGTFWGPLSIGPNPGAARRLLEQQRRELPLRLPPHRPPVVPVPRHRLPGGAGPQVRRSTNGECRVSNGRQERSEAGSFLEAERFGVLFHAASLSCGMQFKFFCVPIADAGAAAEELNGFLRSRRIVAVKSELACGHHG